MSVPEAPFDKTLDAVVQQVRTHCGGTSLPWLGWIIVSGQDAAAFLQSQTSNDVLALAPGQGQWSALTDRKAHVQAFFSLHCLENTRYAILVENESVDPILARLEAYHFTEDVTFQDASFAASYYTLQGPHCFRVLAALGIDLPHTLAENGVAVCSTPWGEPVTVIARSFTGEAGCVLRVPKPDLRSFEAVWHATLQEQGVCPIPLSATKALRIEAGLPKYGLDVDESHLLPETSLEHRAVSYTKGCYIGQEVIARVRTYGTVQKALVGLIFEQNAPLPSLNSEIRLSGEGIGTVKSSTWSPTLNAPIALAYLHKTYRIPKTSLTVDIVGASVTVTVVLLPFYKPADVEARAQARYAEGLQHFAQDRDEQAMACLREAILLNPHLADAYESLGVILARHGHDDEAIALMQTLAEQDPTGVMAHTNLSVFYMKKGMKDAAEHEKALATTLGFRQALAEKQQTQTREKADQAALAQKIAMFTEVLALDPEDSLANYSLGNLYVEQNNPQAAIPLLEQAIQTDPRYTVAYLALGKALLASKQPAGAREVFTRGIAVATQRGDLMPLQEMERLLACNG